MDSEKVFTSVSEVLNTIRETNLIQATVLEGMENEVGDGGVTINDGIKEIFNHYLASDFGSGQDSDMKKLFSAAVAVAADKGVLPFDLPDKNGISIASLVDLGLNRTKALFWEGSGIKDPVEIADALIDYEAARLTAVVNQALGTESGKELVAEAVSNAIVLMFPPIASSKPVIKSVVKHCAEPVRRVINSAIPKVAQYAKNAARQLIAKTKQTVRQVLS